MPTASYSATLRNCPHLRTIGPLVFFHIPKTAGSAMRVILSDMFDTWRIYPGFNFDDYQPYKMDSTDLFKFGLFMGHMTWEAVEFIEYRTGVYPSVVTVLRDPVTHANSQIAFVDRLIEQGVASMINMQGCTEAISDVQSSVADLAPEGTALQCILLLAGLKHDLNYRDMLSAKRRERYADVDSGIMASASRQLKAIIDERLTIGLFDDLRKTADLLCATYTLPYCELTEERLNASGAVEVAAPTEAQGQFMQLWHDLPYQVHRHAEAKFAADYERHFSGITDVKSFLDDGYRARVFDRMPLCTTVDLQAAATWPGTSWQPRESNEHGQHWRRLTQRGEAKVFMRLPRRDYILALRFHSLPSVDVIEALNVTVNGVALTRGAMGFENTTCVQHYLLRSTDWAANDQDRTSATQLTLTIAAPGGVAREIAVSGITAVPSAA